MTTTKVMKTTGLIAGIMLINILALSPGFLNIEIGRSALSTAVGVTLLLASAIGLLYGVYSILFKQPQRIPVNQIQTYEHYVEALVPYRRVKALENDIDLAMEQMARLRKKRNLLEDVLGQRFDPSELSYRKFAAVSAGVDQLFYMNIRSLLNRLNVLDESDFRDLDKRKAHAFSKELVQKRSELLHEQLSFVKSSLDDNEEILLKLDQLLLEISRLDSLEPGEIDSMPGMMDLDALIKQTKYYKA